MKILPALLLLLPGITQVFAQSDGMKSRPSWTKDLIIYEVATRSYTSPAGPESGTFNSLAEKLPYLQKLGINCIWLSGNNWADDKHFFGIWTQYASFRPDSLDSRLGTRAEFRSLIRKAHQHGIRVFLDVITHGVMTGSPLIDAHPDWFKGGSWGMSDYDWKGNHPDLENWWVKTWADYVLKDGVDGFRLDVIIYRPDLWKKIKDICAEKGHPIAVLDESLEPYSPGAFDFYQYYMKWIGHVPGKIDTGAVYYKNMARFFQTDSTKNNFYYSVQLSCHDNGWIGFPANQNPYTIKGSRYVFGYGGLLIPAIPIFMGGEEFNADYKPLPRLSPDLFGKRLPNDSSRWLYGGWLQWDQLKDPEKQAMLNDVTKLIHIRHQEKDLLHAWVTGEERKILGIRFPMPAIPSPSLTCFTIKKKRC